MPETVSEFDKVLPGTIDVWKKAGPPAIYAPETLSTYIDGGAELYISYNFKSALSVKYVDAARARDRRRHLRYGLVLRRLRRLRPFAGDHR